MDEDRIKRSVTNNGGKAKEDLGKATRDKKFESEGKTNQANGRVKNALGGATDKPRRK